MRAIIAATSIGWRTSTIWSIRSGKRTWIRRTIAGQAEEITGRGSFGSFSRSRIALLTTSAPRATSNTSSKPIRFSPPSTCEMLFRLLNWPYRLGAGSAILYLNCEMELSGSVTATFA